MHELAAMWQIVMHKSCSEVTVVKRLKRHCLYCVLFMVTVLFGIMAGCSSNGIAGRPTSTEVVGRIITPDSVAVAGLPVVIKTYGESDSLEDVMSSITDREGIFRFEGIGAGQYLLIAIDDGRKLMKEIDVEKDGQKIQNGTLTIDSMGSLAGTLIIEPDTSIIDINAKAWVYKGAIPLFTRWVRHGFTIDTLAPGEYHVRIYGSFKPQDRPTENQNFIIFDSSVTIFPCTSTVLDTIFVKKVTNPLDDPLVRAEWNTVRELLKRIGLKPEIPPQWIHPLTGHVTTFEAKVEQFESLDSIATLLATIRMLERIRLAGFIGKTIPDTFFTLQRLVELSLTDGELVDVPEQLSKLSGLQYLFLNANKMTNVPEIILDDQKIGSLKIIDLTGNPLHRIEWQQQEMINNLAVSGVTIILAGEASTINERDYKAMLSFFRANNLDDRIIHSYITTGTDIDEPDVVTAITIEDAVISHFPDDFSDLAGLRYLHIARNEVDTLPQVFGNLKKLRTLEITNGKLHTLPMQMGRCTQLEVINLANNRITIIPKWLGALPSLRYADFSFNAIDTANTVIPVQCIINNQQPSDSASAPDSLFARDTAIVNAIVHYAISTTTLPLTNFYTVRNNRVAHLRLVIDHALKLAAFDTLCAMAATLDSMKTLHVVFREKQAVFPHITTEFPKLETFICTGGGFTDLPDSFTVIFPAVRQVSIPGNHCEKVPPVMRKMKKVEAVDLYFNRLHDLSKEDMQWLENVSIPDCRALWDPYFDYSYVQVKTWQASQFTFAE